ncbi:hypothetical protein [Lutimaribacter saemankumensis]|uniref:Uncharacterized protein n=1 Tax=Lutimaribacter saemankumensis TaxID=490829 RepID=A0A1G8SH41_9RHOB|nr:hypothetical protein [Lutimaribacter saemankumensis]SDJ27980.1 hypothetical protein SAMN05421850_11160 [Lutimaribacter saemankumensis]
MTKKTLCFPNGYQTTSSQISRVKIHADWSVFPLRVLIEVFEGEHKTFMGYVDLRKIPLNDDIR